MSEVIIVIHDALSEVIIVLHGAVFVATILQTMRNDGNVLVAVDTAGRMLELAQLLVSLGLF